MKQRMKFLNLLVLAVLLSFGAFAQNQYDAFKKLGAGTYRIYSMKKNGDTYQYYYDNNRKPKDVKFVNGNDLVRFGIETSLANYATKDKWTADKDGYPVAMVRGELRHKEVKYLKSRQKSGKRLIALDGCIVYLSDYKSPSDFTIAEVWKKGGKLSQFKAMKEAMKTEMKMKNEQWPQKVKAYLEKEIAQQDAKISAWKKANPEYEKQLAKDKIKMKELLNWSKNEQKKIDNKYVTITNKAGYKVYFRTKNGATRSIKAGSWEKVDCSISTIYYCASDGSNIGDTILNPSEYCGKSYTIR